VKRSLRLLLPLAFVVVWFLVTTAAAFADSDIPQRNTTGLNGQQIAVLVFLFVVVVGGVSGFTLWRVKKWRELRIDRKEGDSK